MLSTDYHDNESTMNSCSTRVCSTNISLHKCLAHSLTECLMLTDENSAEHSVLKRPRAPQSDLKRLFGMLKTLLKVHRTKSFLLQFPGWTRQSQSNRSLQKQPKARIPCRNHTSYVNSGNVASCRTQIYHVPLQLIQCNCWLLTFSENKVFTL